MYVLSGTQSTLVAKLIFKRIRSRNFFYLKWWTNVWTDGWPLNANIFPLFTYLQKGAKDLIFDKGQTQFGQMKEMRWFSIIFMWKIYFNLCNKNSYNIQNGMGCGVLSLSPIHTRTLGPHEYVSCIICCVARLLLAYIYIYFTCSRCGWCAEHAAVPGVCYLLLWGIKIV